MLILEGLNAPVSRVAFGPDAGAVLASGAAAAGPWCTAVWQLPGAATPSQVLPRVCEALFAPDGVSLLSIRPNEARYTTLGLIDLETLAPAGPARTLAAPEDAPAMGIIGHLSWRVSGASVLFNLRLTPDARRVAAIHAYQRLAWWTWPDLTPLPEWEEWPTLCVPGAFALSPRADRVAVYDTQGRVFLLRADTGEPLWETLVYTHADHTRATYSPDGRFVAVASGTALRVLAADNGEVVARLSQRERFFLDLAFTPDGRFLATVSDEATVKFFDTRSWRRDHEMAWRVGGLTCVAFSADGMLGATGGRSGRVVVWDLDL